MSSTYSAQLSVVSVREDFTKEMASLLTDGAERLVAADMDYEGAMLLALKTRRDLAATSLSLAAEADKTALRLFEVGVNWAWRDSEGPRHAPLIVVLGSRRWCSSTIQIPWLLQLAGVAILGPDRYAP